MSVSEEVVVHTRLTGAAQVTAGLTEEAAATDRLAVSTTEAGLAMERTAKRSFLMNQTLFTMRRFLYMGTLAVTAFSIGAVKWGWDFNSAMQQGRISLNAFLGSTQATNKELRDLFNFAAYTPFQFKDIVKAASTLYAFHFSTQQVNRTLHDMTDALVATGRATPAGLNRISTALGHMMSIGHITGQVLLQLARDGIPGVYESIKKYFGLTDDQMTHIGSLRLPANAVLTALDQGIEQSRLHGLARKQAEGSLHGLFTTFKDFTSQIFGDIETKPFHSLQNLMKSLNPVLQSMGKGFQSNGFSGLLAAMGNGQIANHIRLWVKALQDVWQVLTKGVIPAISVWLRVLQPITAILLIVVSLLGVFTGHATLLKWALVILIGQMIVLRMQTLYLAAAERAAAGAALLQRIAMLDLTIAARFGAAAQIYYAGALFRTIVWTRIATAADWLWTAALYALATAQGILAGELTLLRTLGPATYIWMRLAVAADWLWVTALYAAAIAQAVLTAATDILRDSIMAQFLIAKAVTIADWLWIAAIYAMSAAEWALTAAFGAEATAATIAWAATFLPITIILGALAAVAAAILLIIEYWKQFKQIASGNIGDALGIPRGHWYSQGGIGHAIGLPNWLTGYKSAPKVPGMASGGFVDRAGWAMVGEQGPELRWMPSGAGIQPLNQMSGVFPNWQSNQDDRPIMVQLVVDGKKLAEIVAKHKSDAGARA